MIAGSRAMRAVTDTAGRVAQSDATVLLEGESGTGKELLAKAIHFHSGRGRGPFVTNNCGAIPEQLLESELFGHRRGSFTGAVADKKGKFEAADRGTIFLDEIGELPLMLQVKILRVLQEREVDKVGDTRSIKVAVRVIAATNRDLEKMIADGAFRDDLYYRLAVVSIRVPRLRERTDDIPRLADHFLDTHVERLNKPRPDVDKRVYEAFNRYAWPGNIRELENVIERALVLDRDGRIGIDDLHPRLRAAEQQVGTLRMELPDDGVSLEESREGTAAGGAAEAQLESDTSRHVPQNHTKHAPLSHAEVRARAATVHGGNRRETRIVSRRQGRAARLARLLGCVLLRVLVEGCSARRTAEVVGLAAVVALCGCILLIHLHAAHGIFRHSVCLL
jgi:transcriptional regulator with PAS, ATPase and Fis domain